jgi:glycosyltransferase involved in cell wall biosynthesis
MKVLRIIARLNVGGPARHVVWLTAGLQPMGCETVLVAGVVPLGEDDMSYFAKAAGVTPLILPQMSREISPKDLLTVWKLYRLMRREQPDIVHTHTAKAGTVGRLAGFMYRWLTPAALVGKPRTCRFVHTYHGHVFHSYYGPLKTKLFLMIERILASLVTDRIVVVSEQQREEINERFHVGRRTRFAVIPLGLDLSAFANWEARRPQLRQELGVSDKDILVGIVGRLTEIKNIDLFLQAAARFKEKNSYDDDDGGTGVPPVTTRKMRVPRVRFLIIGDGKLRPQLEGRAKQLGLDEDVWFLGTRSDPENFYPALDIVALTSLNEGTPLTLIEAMANARPVIATAVGGVVDLLGPVAETESGRAFQICERGLRVESGDAEGFALGLARLIEDEPLRRAFGERCRNFVVEHYAKERLLRDIHELYSELIPGESVRPAARVARASRP